MEKTGVQLRIRGRVQGVGYRYFAQKKALAAGLSGWARNLPDGSVEAQAEGARAALEAWIEELRRGPSVAQVDHIELTWTKPDQRFESFEISD